VRIRLGRVRERKEIALQVGVTLGRVLRVRIGLGRALQVGVRLRRELRVRMRLRRVRGR
jgi:hypothetical protein